MLGDSCGDMLKDSPVLTPEKEVGTPVAI